jgi:large subunit ribosomal protein L24
MANARIKKGDTVAVISGRDKGKTGTVLRVIPEETKVIVQGINMVTKHQKPTQRAPEGKRFQKEMPLWWSKVMPVDPATGKPVRKIKTGSIAETKPAAKPAAAASSDEAKPAKKPAAKKPAAKKTKE